MKHFIPMLILLTSHLSLKAQQNSSFALAIHGGAGAISRSQMTDAQEQAYRKALESALDTGYAILKAGGTSIEAITATIIVMENSPLFNAGRGSVFASNGKNEMDASIMDGKTLNAGAVAGVSVIKNPILAAKAVMENSEHVLLFGEGAEAFAKEQDIEIVDPSYFYTKRRKDALDRAKRREKREGGMNWMHKEKDENWKHGTVGAVAKDKYGNLAAATSTGGMTNKKYGRIGDSPVIGAGTYADNNVCAVSCTGHGEYFIRLAIAHDIAATMSYKHMSAEQAGDEVIMKKLTNLGGTGGAIILDNKGNVAMPFNTEGMYRGYVATDGDKKIWIYKKE